MVKSIVIRASSDAPLEEREVATRTDAEPVVDGPTEAIDIPALGITIYVNEEGLLQQLPFNSRAAFLWWHYVPAARQRAMLVGYALIVGMPDQSGNDTDPPAAVREMLTAGATYAVKVRVFGDDAWYRNQARYADYFEALIWAMLIPERWTQVEEARVIRVDNQADGTDRPPGRV